MPVDPKQLAALRKLIGQEDVAAVRQVIELLRTLDDPDLWALMAQGLRVEPAGTITIGRESEVWKRARPPHRGELALWALRGAGRLDDVAVLDIGGLAELADFDALAGLARLRTLLHAQARPLTNNDALSGLARLEQLAVSGLQTLDALSTLSNLRELTLRDANTLPNLDGLADCTRLRSLVIARCAALRDLRGIAGLPELRTLTLDALALPNLSTLAGQTALTELTLSTAPRDLRGIATLTGVRTLSVEGSVSHRGVAHIAAMPSLETLTFSGGPSDLTGLAAAPSLRTLNVHQSLPTVNVRRSTQLALAGPATLRDLTVTGWDLTRLDLADLPGLRSLSLAKCRALTDIGGLARVPNLEVLDLTGCIALEKLDALAGLEALRSVDLRTCPRLHWSIAPRLYTGTGVTALRTRIRGGEAAASAVSNAPGR